MDVFGHVGLTLAVGYPADRFIRGRTAHHRSSRRDRVQVVLGESRDPSKENDAPPSRHVDYRWLIVGSLLPDVIDKPLGFWLAPELVNSSARSVAHTAIFAVLLLAVALTALRLGWSGMGLVPAAGSAGHLVLDQIWRQPSIALWPALGWAFPLGTATFGEWSESHLWDALALYRDPPELAGATVILLLAAKLWRDRAFRRFFGTGAVA